jgi:hypothetical protein
MGSEHGSLLVGSALDDWCTPNRNTWCLSSPCLHHVVNEQYEEAGPVPSTIVVEMTVIVMISGVGISGLRATPSDARPGSDSMPTLRLSGAGGRWDATGEGRCDRTANRPTGEQANRQQGDVG